MNIYLEAMKFSIIIIFKPKAFSPPLSADKVHKTRFTIVQACTIFTRDKSGVDLSFLDCRKKLFSGSLEGFKKEIVRI
ncbi:hypothetical protein BKH43_06940 [Helicobacter sp. 13S00401-1]|nr:hypothetical protein BKH43_06940 [Helicobacter sp. 13S00401-1]